MTDILWGKFSSFSVVLVFNYIFLGKFSDNIQKKREKARK